METLTIDQKNAGINKFHNKKIGKFAKQKSCHGASCHLLEGYIVPIDDTIVLIGSTGVEIIS